MSVILTQLGEAMPANTRKEYKMRQGIVVPRVNMMKLVGGFITPGELSLKVFQTMRIVMSLEV